MKRFLALLCGLLAFLTAAPAEAAFGTPYNLGTIASTTNSATTPIPTVASASVGDIVVVWVALGNTSLTISSVSDDAGNTYAPLSQLTGASTRYRLFWSKLAFGLTSGLNITVTTSGATTAVRIVAMTGFSGADGIDKSLSGSVATSSAPAISLGTLAANDEIICVGIRGNSTITIPITEATSYTRYSQFGTTSTQQISCRVVTSNAADTPTWGLNTSVEWAVQAVSFTLDDPTAGGSLMTLGVE